MRTGKSTKHPLPVHVLRVGPTRYVVFNYFRQGEYLLYLVFTRDFALLSTVGL